MTDLNIPHGVLEAAAERANGEQQSLSEVVTALLRDYAEGRTWANLPVGAIMAVIAGLAQPPEGTVRTHWGVRYPGESGVREYDDEEDAREHLLAGEVLVSCEVTVSPWTEAPGPEEDGNHGKLLREDEDRGTDF